MIKRMTDERLAELHDYGEHIELSEALKAERKRVEELKAENEQLKKLIRSEHVPYDELEGIILRFHRDEQEQADG